MLLTNNPRTLLQLVVQSLVPTSSHSSHATNQSSAQRQTSLSSLLRFGPSTVAASINASTLALLNASSVPLKGVVCSAAVGRVRFEDETVLIVDPSKDELGSLNGAGVFAFLITGGRPTDGSQLSVGMEVEGGDAMKADLAWSSWNALPFDEEEEERAQALARVAALRVRSYMKQAIAHVVHGEKLINLLGKGKQGPSADVSSHDDAKMEIS